MREGERVGAAEEREGEDDGGDDLLREPTEATVHARAPAVANELAVRRAHEEEHGERARRERRPSRDREGVIHRSDGGGDARGGLGADRGKRTDTDT